MSFLSKIKKIPQHLPHGTASRSLGGIVVDKGERYGASYLFGFIKGHYRERAVVRGIPADVLAGGVALLGAAALGAMSGGKSDLAEHLERVGDAGIQSYLNSMGASKGASMAGRQVMVLPGKSAAKTGVHGMSILGALPRNVGGAYLTQQEINSNAAPR